MTSLVEARNIKKYFPLSRGFFSWGRINTVKAVDGVSLHVEERKTLGLVGESGCGKSTLGRIILGLIKPTAGEVYFNGANIHTLNREGLRKFRQENQIVFQDPFASLNPRKTVGSILRGPYIEHRPSARDEIESNVHQLLEFVGLSPPEQFMNRYPHELSGGQRQRIGIARAIALSPKLIVTDEPVSSLDLSIRGQILNLLKSLQEKLGTTYLFITHDLAVVRSMADRVAVMYLGKIVEQAGVDELYASPKHPYTQAILNATPILNPKLARARKRSLIGGEPPSAINPPSGCRFHPRCPFVKPICKQQEPQLVEIEPRHSTSCWLYE